MYVKTLKEKADELFLKLFGSFNVGTMNISCEIEDFTHYIEARKSDSTKLKAEYDRRKLKLYKNELGYENAYEIIFFIKKDKEPQISLNEV